MFWKELYQHFFKKMLNPTFFKTIAPTLTFSKIVFEKNQDFFYFILPPTDSWWHTGARRLAVAMAWGPDISRGCA
jgi:hypothetical protein